MDRAIPDFSSCNSVADWLDTIKMGRYKDHFAAGGYHTLGHVVGMNQGWVSIVTESDDVASGPLGCSATLRADRFELRRWFIDEEGRLK